MAEAAPDLHGPCVELDSGGVAEAAFEVGLGCSAQPAVEVESEAPEGAIVGDEGDVLLGG